MIGDLEWNVPTAEESVEGVREGEEDPDGEEGQDEEEGIEADEKAEQHQLENEHIVYQSLTTSSNHSLAVLRWPLNKSE